MPANVCFAKARRAVQQNMVHRFPALLGGAQVNAQIVFGLFLTDIIVQTLRTQCFLDLFIFLRQIRLDDSWHVASILPLITLQQVKKAWCFCACRR